jgi:hypothetical protein
MLQQLPQHRHPVNVAQRAFQRRLGAAQDGELRLDDARRHVDALEVLGELRELPALVVRKRLVRQSLEQHRAGHHLPVKLFGRFVERATASSDRMYQ